jgi:hypothetical protein
MKVQTYPRSAEYQMPKTQGKPNPRPSTQVRRAATLITAGRPVYATGPGSANACSPAEQQPACDSPRGHGTTVKVWMPCA